MQTIANILSAALSGILYFLQGAWKVGTKFVGNLYTMGLLAFVYLGDDVVDWAKDVWDHLMQYLQSVVIPSVPALGPVVTLLSIGNHFLPLDLLFTLLSAYILLYLTLTVYRWIKSWIPFL